MGRQFRPYAPQGVDSLLALRSLLIAMRRDCVKTDCELLNMQDILRHPILCEDISHARSLYAIQCHLLDVSPWRFGCRTSGKLLQS
ncbi:hypothetical protein AQ767_04705 [Burkholderia pseudomallei]|nr:hypothetical protein AQ767_04705 [Burkholderia pseudomallei]